MPSTPTMPTTAMFSFHTCWPGENDPDGAFQNGCERIQTGGLSGDAAGWEVFPVTFRLRIYLCSEPIQRPLVGSSANSAAILAMNY